MLELHRAIPIPKHDVPLAEVLEFKECRRDELLLLRQHLDTFARDIEHATDKAVALAAKVAEIDQACANLLELRRQRQALLSREGCAVKWLSGLRLVWGSYPGRQPEGQIARLARRPE